MATAKMLSTLLCARKISVADAQTHCAKLEASKDPDLWGFYFVLATAQLECENKTDDKNVIKWLERSVELNSIPANRYQLAYILENEVRQKPNAQKTKQMLRLYLDTVEHEGKAACQLGGYLRDFPKDANLLDLGNHTAESLLQDAHRRGIPQAITNLIMLYKKQNNYAKVVESLQIKYLRDRRDVEWLELSNLMLNANDMFAYCAFMKRAGHQLQGVAAFLKNGSTSVENEECCVCLEKKTKMRKLICTHYICDECLLSLFETDNQTCPMCRAYLVNAQTSEQKQCVQNIMKSQIPALTKLHFVSK